MPAKDPHVYLVHIRDCCRRIAEYTATGGADWPANALVMDAVCRNITIIGEAARRLDEPFRRDHPEIPWSSLVGARNVVMHDCEYLEPRPIRGSSPSRRRQCVSNSGTSFSAISRELDRDE
jgi:uncharacterized protein with HEPN domain